MHVHRHFAILLLVALALPACQPNRSQEPAEDDRVRYIPNELLIPPSDFQGIDGRFLTPEQLEEIRNHFAVNRNTMAIASIVAGECVNELESFEILGEGFGATQDGHTVWLSIRGVDVATVTVVSWSDTRIVARTEEISMPGRYSVGIKNRDNRYVSNRNRTVEYCPVVIPPIGVPPPDYVHPELCFTLDPSEAGLNVECEESGRDCRIVDGGRVVHDYNSDGARNIEQARNALFWILDSLVEQQCIGPTPPPFTRSGTVVRELPTFKYFKKDGQIIGYVGGGVATGIHCEPPVARLPILWDRLEVRLSRETGYWLVGFPEIHGDMGREFGFISISRWNTEADARWVKYMHDIEGIRWQCTQSTRTIFETPFEHWTTDAR